MVLENLLKLEITSADIPSVLGNLHRMNVTVKNIHAVDPLTVQFCINLRDFSVVQRTAQKQGAKIKIIEKQGIKQILIVLIRRPVLTTFILLILALSAFLPTRVLFIESVGAETISNKYIIEKSAECGIRFGASRRKVRSEEMKNKLLSAIPQLHWAGINTYGCVAVITVEEKGALVHEDVPDSRIGSIVAAHDGVITSCTVQKGTQLCRIGQAVKAGEVLVSGYTDCGILLQATCAEAEVTAKTLRSIETISPSMNRIRSGTAHTSKEYCLQIGKKLINFFKDSGICDSSCVKMYSKKFLTLPGGRHLPIAVITESHTHYSDLTEQAAVVSTEESLYQMTEEYLLSHMIAGEITHAKTKIYYTSDCCKLLGTFSCTEMISRVIYEGRIDTYG